MGWLMYLALLAQNLEEYLAGGPELPARLARFFPPLSDGIRRNALLLVSGLALGLVAAGGVWLPLLAGALAFNATVQVLASLFQRRVLPGTLTGALLMGPAALAVLSVSGMFWTGLLLGAALTPVVLAAIWAIAAHLPH